jgi:hypothetical protein
MHHNNNNNNREDVNIFHIMAAPVPKIGNSRVTKYPVLYYGFHCHNLCSLMSLMEVIDSRIIVIVIRPHNYNVVEQK